MLLEPSSGRLSMPAVWLGCEPLGTCTGWAAAPVLAGSWVLPQARVPGAADVLLAPVLQSGVTPAPSAPHWGRPLLGQSRRVLPDSMNKISP